MVESLKYYQCTYTRDMDDIKVQNILTGIATTSFIKAVKECEEYIDYHFSVNDNVEIIKVKRITVHIGPTARMKRERERERENACNCLHL